MAIGKLGQRRQVVIPKNICETVGLQAGGDLEIVLSTDNQILIKPRNPIDLEDTLTPEEEESVARGLQQIKDGEFMLLKDVKAELGL